ncbi:cobalt ECF transporter T component CbiQ [Aquipuribacter nitratireducens]|uniref:Cobalt ECF transporter T component CbiQ n=1 Tax=Aquipuribacter nitratireducens TaxID=650104 RepID=A0ABW0GQ03_9MICO
MGAGHSHGSLTAPSSGRSRSVSDGLYVEGSSVLHRLPAEAKVVGLVAVVVTVVATPREQVWAFGLHALVLAALVAVAGIPARTVLRRMVIEVPFVVFALLLPFVALGERVDVLGLSLSVEGLLGGFNVLAKGTLGVVAAIVLSATTRPRDLLVGLQRLRVPALLVTIVSFMVRYLDVVVDDMRRMAVARAARGFEARHLGHLPVVARGAGALFVRAFERGERVHLAMVSRGFTGTMPVLAAPRARPGQWLLVAGTWVVVAAVAVAAALAGPETSLEPWLTRAAAAPTGVAG